MMLQALIAYAERENLGDADFETVGVRWLIPLDRGGQLAGDPIPLAENPNEKKPRPKAMSRPFTGFSLSLSPDQIVSAPPVFVLPPRLKLAPR